MLELSTTTRSLCIKPLKAITETPSELSKPNAQDFVQTQHVPPAPKHLLNEQQLQTKTNQKEHCWPLITNKASHKQQTVTELM